MQQRIDERAAKAELRPRGKQRRLARQPPRIGEVVGVHARDELAPRDRQPLVETGNEAAILARDDGYATVGFAVALEDLQRPVGRSIVDGDDFEPVIVLPQDRADRGGDIGLGIVDRQKHGDERARHGQLRSVGCRSSVAFAPGYVTPNRRGSLGVRARGRAT